MTDLTDLIIVLGIILIIWVAIAVGIRMVRFIAGPAPIPKGFEDDITTESPWIPEEMTDFAAAQAEHYRRQKELRDREVEEFRTDREKRGVA